jgi:hypothetical protein
MAKQREKTNASESGLERQQRIQREQHRPEQDKGYDEAVKGPVPASERQMLESLETPAVISDSTGPTSIDDREADAAAMDVRRQEHSAD